MLSQSNNDINDPNHVGNGDFIILIDIGTFQRCIIRFVTCDDIDNSCHVSHTDLTVIIDVTGDVVALGLALDIHLITASGNCETLGSIQGYGNISKALVYIADIDGPSHCCYRY